MAELTRYQRYAAYSLGGYGLGVNALALFLVPLRANELGAGIGLIGLLLGLRSLTETVLAVPLGTFIDRIGSKRAYLIGMTGTALVGLGLMATSSIGWLLVLQIVLGVLRPLGWVGGQSYISFMRDRAHRTDDTGKFSFAVNVGQIVSPAIAGAFATLFGTRLAFSTMVLYGVLFFVVMAALPGGGPRPDAAGAATSSLTAALRLFRIRDIQAAMLLSLTRLWVLSVWIPFYPLYLVSTGSSPTLAGTVVSTMGAVATVMSLFSRRLSQLGRPTTVTSLSLAVGCVGVALAPLLSASPWFYATAILVGVCQGLSLPLLLTIVTDAAPLGQDGLALSLRSGVNQAAAAAAPMLVAPIIGLTGVLAGFGFAAALGIAPLVAVTMSQRARD